MVNVGVGKEISINYLAGLLADLTGFDGQIVHARSKPDGTSSIDDAIAIWNCIASTTTPVLISVLMHLSDLFRGKSITSNLIESVFGRLDLAISRSGNHNFDTYDAVFSSWFAMVDQTIDLIEGVRNNEIGEIITGSLLNIPFDEEMYELFSRSSVYSLNNLEAGIKVTYWDNQ